MTWKKVSLSTVNFCFILRQIYTPASAPSATASYASEYGKEPPGWELKFNFFGWHSCRYIAFRFISILVTQRWKMVRWIFRDTACSAGNRKNKLYSIFSPCTPVLPCGLGNSVGIATDYTLDGPGSNSGGDEIFRPSRPALGPTQPPVKWLLSLSRG